MTSVHGEFYLLLINTVQTLHTHFPSYTEWTSSVKHCSLTKPCWLNNGRTKNSKSLIVYNNNPGIIESTVLITMHHDTTCIELYVHWHYCVYSCCWNSPQYQVVYQCVDSIETATNQLHTQGISIIIKYTTTTNSTSVRMSLCHLSYHPKNSMVSLTCQLYILSVPDYNEVFTLQYLQII